MEKTCWVRIPNQAWIFITGSDLPLNEGSGQLITFDGKKWPWCSNQPIKQYGINFWTDMGINEVLWFGVMLKMQPWKCLKQDKIQSKYTRLNTAVYGWFWKSLYVQWNSTVVSTCLFILGQMRTFKFEWQLHFYCKQFLPNIASLLLLKIV